MLEALCRQSSTTLDIGMQRTGRRSLSDQNACVDSAKSRGVLELGNPPTRRARGDRGGPFEVRRLISPVLAPGYVASP